jgi:hypothetical protein
MAYSGLTVAALAVFPPVILLKPAPFIATSLF